MKTPLWSAVTAIALLVPPSAQAAYVVRVDGVVGAGMIASVSKGRGLLPLAAAPGDPMSITYVIEESPVTGAVYRR